MPTLNLDPNLPRHPKIEDLLDRLGASACWAWIVLLCEVGKYSPDDGLLVGWTPERIERRSGWSGTPGELVPVWIELKLLDVIEGGYAIHDWGDHQGHLKVYRTRAKIAANARWNAPSNASSMLQASKMNASSNAPSNAPTVHAVHGMAVPCTTNMIGMDEPTIGATEEDRSNLADRQRVYAACPVVCPAMLGRIDLNALDSLIHICGGPDGAIAAINAAAGKDRPIIYALKVAKNRIESDAAKAQVQSESKPAFRRTPNHTVRLPL